MAVLQFYPEHGIGQGFQNCTVLFYGKLFHLTLIM
jgi:hypothetical protein